MSHEQAHSYPKPLQNLSSTEPGGVFLVFFSFTILMDFGSRSIHNHLQCRYVSNRFMSQGADPAWLPTSVISELQRGDTPEKQLVSWMIFFEFFGHCFASREKPNSLDFV